MSDSIVQNGDPVLRGTAESVAEEQFGTPELADIIGRMKTALDAEKDGVAIAAPQIGIPLRIFVVRYDRMRPQGSDTHEEPDYGVFINPQITRSSRKQVQCDEGCLSVRGIYGKTMRYERATVHARAEDGSVFERGAGGVLAQAYQHEVDHLNGILFVDHATDQVLIQPEDMERAKAERIERRREKALHENEGDADAPYDTDDE